MTSINPRSSAYLREFGLDPNSVGRDDWNEDGYWRFELDSDGHMILDPHMPWRALSSWKKWPEGLDTDHLKRLLNEDRQESQAEWYARRHG